LELGAWIIQGFEWMRASFCVVVLGAVI